ncbi:MAG: aldo/keto reductase [Bacteroidetes bacterium]|nr:aldo/keto reductase [Bacteroidota bacterium]
MNIGLGTAAIGRPQYINIKSPVTEAKFDLETFKSNGRRLLDHAFEKGIRYYDTAPGYGLAEALLIDWLSNKEARDIEIATKWGYTYVANFQTNATQHEVKEHTLAKLNEQWEQSKKLLPFLSTYQIHSATFETSVLKNEAILNRLAELKATHGLKIGISTTGSNQSEVLKTALEVEIETQLLFDAFQVTYNILDQSIAPILKDSIVEGKRFIIKEALANGRIFPNKTYEHYQSMYNYLQNLSQKYEVGIDAIALRFCQDSIHPFKVLSGASEKQHLLENLQMTQFELQEEEIQLLHKFQVSPDSYWKERSALSWN